MTVTPRTRRRLDHLVLPVPDLAVARTRLTQLGFTIAPEARHPFGTENARVFFSDGAYLEPLAVAVREDCEAAAIAGNVFVARDQAYRFRRGDNGFSAFVVSSPNAAADHARFVRLGMSAGDILTFSPPPGATGGVGGGAAAHLAFAADLRSPDFFAFSIERAAAEPGSPALRTHANGATGIAEVVLSDPNPTDFQYYLQEVADTRETEAHSFGVAIALEGATVTVLNADGMEAWFGRRTSTHARGLRGRAIVFRVADLAATARLLAANGVATREIAGRLIVDEAPGQGAICAFEDTK
jgi:hypothetical protein